MQCLFIKLLGTESDPIIGFTRLILPKTIKTLKWQQVGEQYIIQFIKNQVNLDVSPHLGFSGLQHLSLVLNKLTDRLITTITSSLPLLVELELEDRPLSYPELPDDDLTNDALKSLGLCPFLSSLLIVRSRATNPVACFFRVNDLGMSLLSSSCEALESVTLGGFIKVTGVGFSSFLHSCPNLKKFEVRDAPLLTDLAFHNNDTGVVFHRVELKLVSCNHITSEILSELASSTTLESLDLDGYYRHWPKSSK
ncbi:hypothetical protein ACJIZ3_004035 [Penstemon smallii]|uniref:F-box/LRR-repeat protein 15-like leucin rich repeat domain-containing protein n=1 Tax=Penstemon smallii TaxID=265156 RepID=A0ABD3S0X2_9LAMI